MTTTVAPFEVLRFEAAPVAGGVAVLELDGRFTGRPAARPHLLVESVVRRELPAVCVRFDPWSATFAVPLDVLEDEGTTFALVPDRGPLIALPTPDVVAEGDGDRYVRMARTANELRHRLAAMAERAETAEAELRELDGALTNAIAERDDAHTRIEILESELFDVRTQLTDVAERADVATTEVIETRTRAEAAEAEVIETRTRAEAAEAELAALQERAHEVENELADALARAEAAEAQAYDLRGALETARETRTVTARPETEGAETVAAAETVATEVVETPDDREARLIWGASDDEPEDEPSTEIATRPWWASLEERIPASLTPARIAVGGALLVLFLWLVLIFLGLGPV